MNSGDWALVFFGIVVGANAMNMVNYAVDATYKAGQVDCIQGKVQYSLKLQDDGTTKWVFEKKDE